MTTTQKKTPPAPRHGDGGAGQTIGSANCTTKTNLDHALTLAEKGWPVFPCNPDKTPATAHGHKDASTDPAIITAWWTRSPDALIGIATGKESGLAVLDIDIDASKGKDGWKALQDAGKVPTTTRTHATPRGGWHCFYRYREGMRCSASKIAPGVDFRGDGGYIIYWPAEGYPITNDDLIADPPEWMVEATIKTDKPKPAKVTSTATAGSDRYADRALESATFAVINAANGTR